MNHRRIIPHRPIVVALLALMVSVLLAAALNVPWALTRMHSRLGFPVGPFQNRTDEYAGKGWPSSTPLGMSWPAPDHWGEISEFGLRFLVAGNSLLVGQSRKDFSQFGMRLQQSGWPYPVIERKEMSWNSKDPTLGLMRQPDPSLSLMPQGLILNPLLVGGSAWAILMLSWLAIIRISGGRSKGAKPTPRQRVVQRRPVLIAGVSLVSLVLLAAAVEVPWALTRLPTKTMLWQIGLVNRTADRAGGNWPSATPHQVPWPSPDYWMEGHGFGCRAFDVRNVASSKRGGHGYFIMYLQQMGWPYPVIERKEMSWDHDNPALKGPEPDPAPSLVPFGLAASPLLLGGSVWVAVALPWLTMIFVRRGLRRRHACCLECGYPIGSSPVCTECGSALG